MCCPFRHVEEQDVATKCNSGTDKGVALVNFKVPKIGATVQWIYVWVGSWKPTKFPFVFPATGNNWQSWWPKIVSKRGKMGEPRAAVASHCTRSGKANLNYMHKSQKHASHAHWVVLEQVFLLEFCAKDSDVCKLTKYSHPCY